MSRLAKLKLLSLSEWQLLFVAFILLPLTALSLKLFSFKQTQLFIDYAIPAQFKTPLSNQQGLVVAKITARMVIIAANHGLCRASCLEKSLVLWFLLKRKGIGAQLRIGVHKEEGIFNAHAWVELYGKVLIDSEDTVQRYCTMI